jgi:hypothetical protein
MRLVRARIRNASGPWPASLQRLFDAVASASVVPAAVQQAGSFMSSANSFSRGRARQRLIRNAAIYGGIFWAFVSLTAAWVLSWAVAPDLSDLLHLALAFPPLAYFVLILLNIYRVPRIRPGPRLPR